MNLLTIDWDFFVPEDLMLDMGHRENQFFFVNMWMIRTIGTDLQKRIKTNGREETFWPWLKERGFQFDLNTPIRVTESHLDAFQLGKSANKIYSFDAHSDLGYSAQTGCVKKLNDLIPLYMTIDCGNWLGALALYEWLKIKREITIVWSPETNEDHDYFETILKLGNIKIIHMDSLGKQDRKIDLIHICRSGAWTPPWLDKKFFQFFKKFRNVTCEIEPRKFKLDQKEHQKAKRFISKHMSLNYDRI